MAIVDGRTSISTADATTNWDDLAGSAAGTQNTDTFIEGSASVSLKLSQATLGLLYDFGTATDFSNNHFYFWWNVATAGLLDTLAGGGIRMRFCGATVTDFFEKYLDGKDTYSGGFKMSVVDIERARSDAVGGTLGGTGGTTPATNAIRWVGIVFDHPGMISGNFQNGFVDACWRLPANTPGIRVEGQASGPADWTWDDIVAAADSGDTTKAWGSVFQRHGVIFINTPIRFGANDATTHGFSDTDEVIAWEDHLVASDFYDLEIIGGSGVQSFQMGTRIGSGDASTGVQGGVITAATAGQRWSLTANDANIDVADFFGTTFLHGGSFLINDVNTELRSTQISDVTDLTQSGSTFQRNIILNANTADGVAFVTTNDLVPIKTNAFTFSDGHAIELTATGTYAFTSNSFTGYGADGTNDAAIYNNSGGAVTINIEGVGATTPTIRNGSGASTTVNNTVTLSVHVQTKTGVAIADAQVYIQLVTPDAYTSTASDNAQGDTTFVVAEAIDANNAPAEGWIMVYDASATTYQNYRYASWATSTFTLRSKIGPTASTGGGTSTSLQDTVTDFTAIDVEEGDTVRNETDGSWAIVDEIVDADNITTTALQGGTNNIWTSGNTYSFHSLAVAYNASDTVEVPLMNDQTDASGDVSASHNYGTTKTITVRVRKSSSGVTRYVPLATPGSITASGYSATLVLNEDDIAAA